MSGLEVWLLPSLWFFLLNPKWIDSHWFHLKPSLIQQLHTHGSFLTWTVGKVFSTTLSGSRISLFSVFCCFCSVTQSCTTLCDSHKLRHTRVPCPSPSPRAWSNLCPLGQWCHPIISSSVVTFLSCLQSLPASGSFQMTHLFTSDGQSIGASASASVLPMNIQDWFPLGLTDLISLQSKELSQVFSNTTIQKHQFFGTQLSLL